jgi:hypothetical protein
VLKGINSNTATVNNTSHVFLMLKVKMKELELGGKNSIFLIPRHYIVEVN